MPPMIKEIALDPCLFAQWGHHLALRDAFGVEKGRVISAFPKKWRGHVREEVNRLEAAGQLGPVKAKSLLAWLDVPAGSRDHRMVVNKANYDSNKAWHLNAEDAWRSFDAILSVKEIDVANAILADDDQEYLRDPKLSADIQCTIQRQRGPMVECVWPLLRDSKMVKLIEPHFNPNKPRFRNVLEALLDRLHTEGASIREIELHVRHPEDRASNDLDPPSFTIPELRSKLSPLLRTDWGLRIHLWKRGREKMHPRYLLTDRGGIQIDHGWDEGEHPTETTPVLLLTQTRWAQEMARYQLGSADFKITPESDVIVVQ
jgi:hypothetical protein